MAYPVLLYGFKTVTIGQRKRIIQQVYRQRRPYNLRLPYLLQVYVCNKNNGYFSTTPPTSYPSRAAAVNKSYERFIGKLGDRAENAVNVIQFKQSLSLIEKRGMQLYRFTRALRRGRIAEASAIIGVKARPRSYSTRRAVLKEFGTLWLEYSYGIAPLVKDIYNSLDILQRGLPPFRITASGSHSVTQHIPGTFVYDLQFRTSCRHLADIHVSNPNLWVANQMGLVNPGSWLWEAIPFSFVVDWFTNVGQVIASLSDLAGLSLVQPITTIKSQSHEIIDFPAGGFKIQDNEGFFLERQLGIATPTLGFRPFKGFSPARAANAISLLLVQLRP